MAAIFAVLALAAGSRLTFDPDLLNLIPQKNKQVNDFRKVLRDLGTMSMRWLSSGDRHRELPPR